MSIPIPQFSFAAGELSPAMFGRVDLAKYRVGASTMRNMFVSYRGGANSRAGTALVGQSMQTYASGYAPRLIKFQYNLYQGYALEFGELYLRIIYRGAYITDLTPSITGISQSSPAIVTAPAHGFSNGNWVQITGVAGMLQINNNTYIVQGVTTNTFQLTDLNGNPINSTSFFAYQSGGTASRIYTVTAPYHASDLALLKFTQSADVMSLTHPSYPPYDLTRVSNNNWTFTQTQFSASIAAPATCTAVATVTGSPSTSYAYVVTAVDVNGNESVASPVANVLNSVDIAATAGSIEITWGAVTGAEYYNVYKAPPAYGLGGAPVPSGVLFGYMAQASGLQYVDNNITADFTQVPPLHLNPFAAGSIKTLNSTFGGSGYTTATATINTTTGSGFVALPVIVGGVVASWIIQNAGQNYANTDTVTVTGDGSGATATITLGKTTGTYPGVVTYFQERRGYANTNNQPDTYFFSQTGNYTNFDARIPPIDSDAITGTPWAQQVSGIQFMVPMPSGLIVLTGLGAWQLIGQGSYGSVQVNAFTATSQQAIPQAYNGCHDHVPPIQINYDILYVQAKGSIVRDLSYNFFVNIYTGTDITILSNHLFEGYQINEWGWAEEPSKLVWAVRSDGTLLSLTYLKEQEVSAWAHHDTNGLFVSVCVVTEPPVDAPYFVVQRYIGGQWNYYVERMDNRGWNDVEDVWAVDCGSALPQSTPEATLNISSATGSQNVTEYIIISGGAGYTAPQGEVIDQGGTGSGATVNLTVTGGVITGAVPVDDGSDYTGPCSLEITDTTGSDAVIQPVITNLVTVTCSSAVFTNSSVGSVIRISSGRDGNVSGPIGDGGGKLIVTQYLSPTQVLANIVKPITTTIPNDPNNTPSPRINAMLINIPQVQWSIAAPVSTIYGLSYLNGMEVQILADGAVLPPQTVVNGTITLPVPASQVTVGLGFTSQLQLMPIESPGGASSTTKRKDIYSVGFRVENSRGVQVGTNQQDASQTAAQQPQIWVDMREIADRSNSIAAGSEVPLFSGDVFAYVYSEMRTLGQVALQNTYPLPLNVLCVVSDVILGDEPGQ